jgi:hypothetical protein
MNPDLKKTSVTISAGLTAIFEALVNLLNSASVRQVLSAFSVLLAYFCSLFFIYRMRCWSKNVQIKTLEDEILSLGGDQAKIDKCKEEILKLKREKSKIDFFKA